ncbi:MAG: hypothetical protein KUA35_13755 [Pseudodesulfovibrio sp.]|uniref:Uncharacterized protein n=1 Tax=Pseudodesulfovibrio aespoeensis (strain ATCC 700646 / DSM 10631 / Aspo-2) TaxID=643562 RepID=E6VZ57_PSEA9|nr:MULTISPECIES: hypothetical protein [Pseudodesulfovibrio]MBU4192345.1 hypothetical protein [Pseudomonadota bacterium]ADU62833.1 hypothetical protein Daes_1821 [Pseudodesulfovibrio aespoeensis Aspo-2]MBU4245265.1 hypothetical protein [Pseudomonadota bacterium]MBU4380156.1 hypothetical protein [Pseudomonadota bacterium]MBU4474596.1 hypothetical protein [Pseudomonadota bacterium]
MRSPSFSFPDWIREFVPGDELFARAYSDISDRNRAWMKTAIARLHDWYGPRKVTGGETALRWRAGFDSRSAHDAVDFAVVLFDGSLLSPSRLLAALVPAIAGGVGSVLAVRVSSGTPWRKAILTGLELAGQELVVDMSELQARRLFNELRESNRPGAVAVLGPRAAVIKTNELQAASRISFWRPRYTRAAAIWMDDESTFDLDALAFIHPDIVFSVFGAEPELPAENFSYEGEGFDSFLDAIMDVAYVPAARVGQTLGRARIVLGPGQEGCWIWPDLHPEHFQFQSIAWTTGD